MIRPRWENLLSQTTTLLLLSLGLSIFLSFPSAGQAEVKPKPQFMIKWGTISPENSLWGDVLKACGLV